MGSPRCDFRKNGKRCHNKAHREVYYSKSGEGPKKAWVGLIPAKFVRGRGLVRDRSKETVRRFMWDLPRDLAWSYLCRSHFETEREASRLIMWGSV